MYHSQKAQDSQCSTVFGCTTSDKIGCSALCLFRSANVYCLYCCYGNEHSVGLFWTMDFYFDIIQIFVSWEWQQLLDSYLETHASYGRYAHSKPCVMLSLTPSKTMTTCLTVSYCDKHV